MNMSRCYLCMKPTSALLLGLFSLTFTNVLTAQNVPSAKDICLVPGDANKSQYHLFNPTPTGLMRELSTDRPDKTESPYTVDAGHLQIEVDLLSWMNYGVLSHSRKIDDVLRVLA